MLPQFLAKQLLGNKLKCVDVGARGGLQGSWARFRDFIETDALEPDPAHLPLFGRSIMAS